MVIDITYMKIIKCVNINQVTHKKLMLYKLSNDFKSIDQAVNSLLDYKEENNGCKNGR
jgi:hypothetical protein